MPSGAITSFSATGMRESVSMEFHGRVSTRPLLPASFSGTPAEDQSPNASVRTRASCPGYVSPRHSQSMELGYSAQMTLDTPESVHCSAKCDDGEDSIEVLKSTLGISFEYNHPWWFRLAGGGWNTAGSVWTIWAIVYSAGVFGYAGYQTMVTLLEEDSVHGTEVIVTPHVKTTIDYMQKVMTIMGFLTHSFLQIQILRCVGDKDSMARHSSHATGLFACIRGWSWCELRLENSERSRILAAPSLGCLLFVLLATVFLVVGNCVNPGDYSYIYNIVIWYPALLHENCKLTCGCRGIFGAFFGWYPYVVVSTMFATDCVTQMRCLHALQVIIRTKGFDEAHTAYFVYYNTMRRNVKSYKATLLVQICYLLMAVLCNSVTILAEVDPTTSNTERDEYRILALFIAMLCFIQCVYPVVYAGVVNQRAEKLRRAIAKQTELHLLLESSAVCYPGVEIGGFTVSLSRFAVLSLTYLGIIFVGWIKNVSGYH